MMLLTTTIPDDPFTVDSARLDRDRGAVDRLQAAVTDARDGHKAAVCNPGFWPAEETLVTRRLGAIGFRDVGARREGQQPPDDAVRDPSVIHLWYAPRLARRPLCDERSLRVG